MPFLTLTIDAPAAALLVRFPCAEGSAFSLTLLLLPPLWGVSSAESREAVCVDSVVLFLSRRDCCCCRCCCVRGTELPPAVSAELRGLWLGEPKLLTVLLRVKAAAFVFLAWALLLVLPFVPSIDHIALGERRCPVEAWKVLPLLFGLFSGVTVVAELSFLVLLAFLLLLLLLVHAVRTGLP